MQIPLVNAHTHAAMVKFRGQAEDLPLFEWLQEHIWPAEAKEVNTEMVYEQTKKAIKEMQANKIAAFCDMYFFAKDIAKAAKELKMPAVISESLIDFPTPSTKSPEQSLEITEKLAKKYQNDTLIKISVAPHSIYSVSEKYLIQAKELAKKYD